MMRRITSSIAAFGIAALLAAFNALAAEPPALSELLKALNLSGYPSAASVLMARRCHWRA